MLKTKMLLLAAIAAGALAAPATAQTYTNTWSWVATQGTAIGSTVGGTISGFSNGTNLSATGLTFTVTKSPYADLLGIYTQDVGSGSGNLNQYTASNGLITAISTLYRDAAGNRLYMGFNDPSGYVPELANASFSEDLYTTSKTATEFTAVSTSAVPEPATWAMTIVGLGAVGFAMRRKNVATRVQFA